MFNTILTSYWYTMSNKDLRQSHIYFFDDAININNINSKNRLKYTKIFLFTYITSLGM